MGTTATEAPLALAGALAKFLFVFKHPMVVTFENYASSVFKGVTYMATKAIRADLTPEMRQALDVSAAAGGVGAMMAFYEFIRDAINADKDSIMMSYTETFNPFQLTRDATNLFYASIVAPLLGTPVSEEAHREIVASNVAFAMNLLGGKQIGQAIKEDGGAYEFLTGMRKVLDIPEIMHDIIMNPEVTDGDISVLFDKRAEFRQATSTLTSSDPIWWAQRLTELAFLRDPNDPQTTKRFQQDTAMRTFASGLFGMSVWRKNPEYVRRAAYSGYYRIENHKRHRDFIARTGGRYGSQYNQASQNMVQSLINYGKVFPPTPKAPQIRLAM